MDVPQRIGKYAISAVLGQGAMGVVYKGFDPHIHRPVAIKVVHKALLGGQDAQDSIGARFRNEAQAVGRIAHPGVVAIYEYGEDDLTAYIAMEFVAGRSLDRVLADTPRLAEAEALRILDQLLDALGAAHAQGVWHRDIKPGNLIVADDGRVKLTDFGIARIESAGITQVASTIGTPGYMAPEQYTGDAVDHRTDLYSCGVLLHRLLTGHAPFSGSPESIMYKTVHEVAPLPSAAVAGGRDDTFDAVVARAMAKQPGQRYASAAEMRLALRAAAAGGPTRGGAADDEDATVIVAVPRPPAAAAPARHPGAGDPAPGAPTTIARDGWGDGALGRIERALTSQIGPMARLIVREAATRCGDVPSLVAEVSSHIPDVARRQAFIGVATGGSQARAATLSGGREAASGVDPHAPTQLLRRPGADAPVPPASASARPARAALTEAFQARALQAMVRSIGPIARVVVRRAGEQSAGERGRFVEILVEAAAERDRAALRRELDGLD